MHAQVSKRESSNLESSALILKPEALILKTLTPKAYFLIHNPTP
jgi:hypothetical protein